MLGKCFAFELVIRAGNCVPSSIYFSTGLHFHVLLFFLTLYGPGLLLISCEFSIPLLFVTTIPDLNRAIHLH